MAKKHQTFLLVSLEEDQAKKLATVVSSDACKKILSFLSEKESATETEVSKSIGMPLPTVHYNLKQLVDSGMVQADEFHYSEKGKEVNHYSLANKYIIIAPKKTESLANKLRKILPVALAVGTLTFAMKLAHDTLSVVPEQALRAEAAPAPMLAAAKDSAVEGVQNTLLPQVFPVQPGFELWFFYGAIVTIVGILVVDLIREHWQR